MPSAVFEFSFQRIETMELTSLLLTYVKICGTVARVISNKPRLPLPSLKP